MGEIIFSGVRCQITWRPPFYPIGLWGELFTPIGPLFQLQYNFLAFSRTAEKCTTFCAALEYVLPFPGRSHSGTILDSVIHTATKIPYMYSVLYSVLYVFWE